MTKDQYVESIRMMMDNQDRYFMWFLGILGVVLVFVGVLQWRLSSNQIKKITIDAKEEARKEIMEELAKNYGIKNINTLIDKSKELEGKIIEIDDSLKNIDFENRKTEELRFYADLAEIPKTKNCSYELFKLLVSHSVHVYKDDFDIVGFIEYANRDRIVLAMERQEDTYGFKEYLNELHNLENHKKNLVLQRYIEFIEKIYVSVQETRQ